MHEMSLCEGIVQILEAEAQKQDYTVVKTVFLEVGKLAGVEIEALEFCYDVVCKNSIAAGSRLKIIPLAGQAWCMRCAAAFEIESRHSACPTCGSYQLQVTGGDALRIRELEVA